VTIDFRSDRSESPFFGARGKSRSRFLEPLRSGPPRPMSIAKEGGGCS